MVCPEGTYALPGSTQASDCEACAAGQYDHNECHWEENMVFSKDDIELCADLQTPVTPCFQVLGYAKDEAECIQWAYERAPLGSVIDRPGPLGVFKRP